MAVDLLSGSLGTCQYVSADLVLTRLFLSAVSLECTILGCCVTESHSNRRFLLLLFSMLAFHQMACENTCWLSIVISTSSKFFRIGFRNSLGLSNCYERMVRCMFMFFGAFGLTTLSNTKMSGRNTFFVLHIDLWFSSDWPLNVRVRKVDPDTAESLARSSTVIPLKRPLVTAVQNMNHWIRLSRISRSPGL